jgi:hypothetical protein
VLTSSLIRQALVPMLAGYLLIMGGARLRLARPAPVQGRPPV